MSEAEMRPYEVLLTRCLEQATKDENAELYATLKAAMHQHNTLLGIAMTNSLTAFHPTKASVALTDVDEVAEKVLAELKRRQEDESANEEIKDSTNGEHDTLG